MTQKDYQLIANALKTARRWSVNKADDNFHNVTCNELAEALAEDNPRFDASKFLEACGVD